MNADAMHGVRSPLGPLSILLPQLCKIVQKVDEQSPWE